MVSSAIHLAKLEILLIFFVFSRENKAINCSVCYQTELHVINSQLSSFFCLTIDALIQFRRRKIYSSEDFQVLRSNFH
jgi:hypothetical protein